MADTFTDEELQGDVDPDFTPDISQKEALEEVKRARRHSEFLKKRDEAFAQMKKYHDQPKKLWRIAYRWLMYSNPDARADINAIIEECRQVRETRANRFARSKDINMRYGMRIPRIVIETLEYVDPRIKEIETLDPAAAKKMYRDIEATFPEFRIPKQD